MKGDTITKEKFLAYEAVRQSGITNMFDVKVVRNLASVPLTDEECHDIMKNYLLYKDKYLKQDTVSL